MQETKAAELALSKISEADRIRLAEAILNESNDHRIVKRMPEPVSKPVPEGVNVFQAVYLDTETTGVDSLTDKVIEIALIPFDYDLDGNIYTIYEGYNGLEDPGFPIEELITDITGITDEDVAGKSFDDAKIIEILSNTSVVLAHNARFDRAFCEGRWEAFKHHNWACSYQGVDWREEDVESAKLEYIAYRKGFFYEGHRASIDCYAGISVMQKMASDGQTLLKKVLDNARKPTYEVWAIGAPFAAKDALKKNGYHWNDGEDGNPKAWSKELTEENLLEEREWLNKEVYGQSSLKPRMNRITAQTRYSKRLIQDDLTPLKQPSVTRQFAGRKP